MKAVNSLFLCLSVLLCTSCTQQEEESSASLSRSPLEKLTITAGKILSSPNTRVIAEREENVMHFSWEKGDAILLANAAQQLPYISTGNGPTTMFISALTGSTNEDDYLRAGMDDGEVYACYPFTGEKMDMKSKTISIDLEEPFLYAVDTIHAAYLDLHFHHVFAYLKLNVTIPEGVVAERLGCAITPNYPPLTLIEPKFNFGTLQVEYIDYWDEMELNSSQFLDAGRLYSIPPVSKGESIVFSAELTTADGDPTNRGSSGFYFEKNVPIPEGGLKAGHVYQINLILTPSSSTRAITQ